MIQSLTVRRNFAMVENRNLVQDLNNLKKISKEHTENARQSSETQLLKIQKLQCEVQSLELHAAETRRLHEESKSKEESLERKIRILSDGLNQAEEKINTLTASNHGLSKNFDLLNSYALGVRDNGNNRLAEYVQIVQKLTGDNNYLRSKLKDSKKPDTISTQQHPNPEADVMDRIEEEISQHTLHRKQLFNHIQDIRGNIRVFCRVRPPKQHQQSNTATHISFPQSSAYDSWTIFSKETRFTFDHVFRPGSSQQDIYRQSAGVVEAVLDGNNVCLFAYGQTGSGKTHTMEGSLECPGINPRAIEHLFELYDKHQHRERRIQLSVIEFHKDGIWDLLQKNRTSGNLSIRQSTRDGESVCIPHLTRLEVKTAEQTIIAMRRASKRRKQASTMMNSRSSRSHLVVEIQIVSQQPCEKSVHGKLHLVDLAGSERVQKSKATGIQLKRGTIHQQISFCSWKRLQRSGKTVATHPLQRFSTDILLARLDWWTLKNTYACRIVK